MACVIFDEIHYINDRDRGKVWEETIMFLPSHIQLIMLSATIDKSEIFAQWIEDVKTNEEYQKLVQDLRKKVGKLQQEREKSLNEIAELRKNARTELLKSLNPIIKEYMEANKIRLVLDKKSILLGDTNLEITTQIIDILNTKVKSLNLK